MPDGSVGMLTRVDIDARMGHKAGDGLNGWKKLCRDFHFRLASNTNRNDDQSALKPPVWDI
jgi:hypothetical protein